MPPTSLLPQALPHLRLGLGAGVSAGSLEAATIGVETLRRGGNVFDAAIAVASALHCTNTPAIGFGGDLVVIGRERRDTPVECLLALGPAPMAMSAARLRSRGHEQVPRSGVDAVAVPAFVDGILALAERGRLDLDAVLAPVADLAERGVVTQNQYANYGFRQRDAFGDDAALATRHAVDQPTPPATVRRFPTFGRWLRTLGADPDGGRRSFVDQVVALSTQSDGLIGADDFERSLAEWVAPVEVPFGPATVWTTPAPTQGPLLAHALAAAQRLDVGSFADVDRLHALIEITKATYRQRGDELGDPAHGGPSMPLTEACIRAIVDAVAMDRTGPLPDWPATGGTTVATVVDGDGGCLSLIGSISLGFGAGVGVLGGDVLLNNRLCRSASFDAAHPTGIAGGRRPVNTLHTWFADAGDEVVAGGTPGGDDQIPWNLQALSDHFLGGIDWGKTLAAPRFRVVPQFDLAHRDRESGIRIEDLAAPMVDDLRGRGHEITSYRSLGGCMRVAISRPDHLGVGSDERQEGASLAW